MELYSLEALNVINQLLTAFMYGDFVKNVGFERAET